ncbi:MAG: class I SAM-dependent methyltransferase, partial [Angustibacter sp.]
MSFAVNADAYDRFMGRFSTPLAEQFVELLSLDDGARALDVGCGPGALTRVLVARLGVGQVAAVDPAPPFVAAVRERCAGVDARQASADALPFADATFDVVAAQLVVHFMPDPVAGLREMARVAAPGGLVAASVWDHAGGSGPLAQFWDAVRDLDVTAPDESELPGTRRGDLPGLAEAAGLTAAQEHVVSVHVPFGSFDDWWAPFTLGVGPAGAYVRGLDDDARERLRDRCAERLGD